jgi:hypothetical protein
MRRVVALRLGAAASQRAPSYCRLRGLATGGGTDKQQEQEQEQKASKQGGGQDQPLYLHIAPCGDHWQAPAIFAAKHLPAGFIRSFAIPPGFCADHLTESACRAAYDTGKLPPSPPARRR